MAPTNQPGSRGGQHTYRTVSMELRVQELILESVQLAVNGIFASNFFQSIAANNNGDCCRRKKCKITEWREQR